MRGSSTTTTTEVAAEEPELIELTRSEGTERATFSDKVAGEGEDLEEGIRRCEGGGVMFDSAEHNLAGPATNPLASW